MTGYRFEPRVEWLSDEPPVAGQLVYTISLDRPNPIRLGSVRGMEDDEDGVACFKVVEWCPIQYHRHGALMIPEGDPPTRAPSTPSYGYADAAVARNAT